MAEESYTDAETSSPPSRPAKKKRGKYATKACHACQRRKVKCDGGSTCPSCLQQNITCTYSKRAQLKMKMRPLKEREKASVQQTVSASTSSYDHDYVLERLKKIEKMISDIDRGLDAESRPSRPNDALISEHLSYSELIEIGTSNDLNDDQTICCEDRPYETEIFEMDPSNRVGAALSSHIYALKRSLFLNLDLAEHQPLSGTSSRADPREKIEKSYHIRGLPAIGQINLHISRYFDEMSFFFPCVDKDEFLLHLSKFENGQNLMGRGGPSFVQASNCTFMMLLCIVLSIATYLDPKSHGEKSRMSPGWQYFLIGEQISEKSRAFLMGHVNLELDLVRYHTLKAVYLFHAERLSMAYSAIVLAVQFAFRIGLNDQLSWKNCSKTEKLNRQLLWWTIYYVDRLVAQKYKRPYLIRESEVNVDEIGISEPMKLEFRTTGDGNSPNCLNSASTRYVQTQISWARLWGNIWDTLFAAKIDKNKLNTEAIELLDARILLSRRKLHQSLTWETSLLQDYMASGESDLETRSRLVTFVRINMLRLRIRQNPLHLSAADPYGAIICTDLAGETINAVLAYMKTQLNLVPFGLHATECILECVCHLAPHLASDSIGRKEHLLSSFQCAVKFLGNLSHTLSAARRASTILHGIVTKLEEVVSKHDPCCEGDVSPTFYPEPPGDNAVSCDQWGLYDSRFTWEPMPQSCEMGSSVYNSVTSNSYLDSLLQDVSYR